MKKLIPTGMYVITALAVLLFSLNSGCEKNNEGDEEQLTWQQKDSISIVNEDWVETVLADGIILKTGSLEIFSSTQAVFLVEIDTATAKEEFAFDAPGYYEKTSVLASGHNALLAINGTFFHGDYSSTDSRHFIKIDNEIIYHTQDQEFDTRATGVITISNGLIGISDWNRQKESQEAAGSESAMVSGPLVLLDHDAVEMWDDNYFVYSRHPRTFIATTDEGKVILGVIDGRDEPRAYGMSLPELRFFAQILRYKDLLNLDGGGSSTLYVEDYDADDLVNIPSDDTGERLVGNIIYLTEK